MNKRIKNILRCYAAGIGIKETASTFHISRNTVRKYVRLFLSSGKSIEQLLSLPNGQLDELFGCTDTRHREPSSKRIELEALLPGYVSRLSRKGMSVRKLFKEYHTEYPDGYQLSSFKRIVSEYRFHIKVVGHVEHYAAEQMYIDFAGDRLEVVDEMTGETKKAEVFVAILPFSHYTYCEAVWSQRKEDLIKACENAIQYFEGVPAAIVSDNLKAAVTRSDRNEPVINDDFAAFAEYYGCVVYPARVRHPKDKALVENAVKLLYRSIYLDIEGMTFSSLEELNTAIHISLLDFNEKVMAGLGQGLAETGRLNPRGRERAFAALRRFSALAKGMDIGPLTCVATAAVRDAEDGPEFQRLVEKETGLHLHVIDGREEARLSAQGVLLGWPEASGLICDIGGNSMELAVIGNGTVGAR